MLSQIKLEGFEHNLKTMSVKSKMLKDDTTVYLVVTEDDAICGIYSDEATAKAKLPIIAYNLYKGKIPKKFAVKSKYNNKRK